MPAMDRTSIPGGQGSMAVLPGTYSYPYPGGDFPISQGSGIPAVYNYPGTLGQSGPGRNEQGQFAPRYGGEGVLEDVRPPATRVTNTIGMPSNNRVHYQSLANPNLPYDHDLMRQSLLFHKCGTGTTTDKMMDPVAHTTCEAYSSMQLPMYMTLPMVNFMLASSARADQEPMTARQAIEEFAIAGAVYATMGVTASDHFKHTLIGFGIEGPEQLYNIWGHNIRQETHLYIIVKEIDVPPHYILDCTGGNFDVPRGKNGAPLRSRCIQYIPWADFRKQIPTDEDVAYIDSNGDKRMGAAIHVGRVQFTYVLPSSVHVAAAPFHVPSMIACKPLSVHMTTPEVIYFD